MVDGDTVDLDLDLGFSLTLLQRVRLYDIYALELRSKDPAEMAKGQESQAFVAQWFKRPGAVLVDTTRRRSTGGCWDGPKRCATAAGSKGPTPSPALSAPVGRPL